MSKLKMRVIFVSGLEAMLILCLLRRLIMSGERPMKAKRSHPLQASLQEAPFRFRMA